MDSKIKDTVHNLLLRICFRFIFIFRLFRSHDLEILILIKAGREDEALQELLDSKYDINALNRI